MGWPEGRRKSLEWSIKFTMKALLAQLGLIMINIAGIAWNAYCLYRAHPDDSVAAFGFGLGAFTSNLLWTLGHVAKYCGEIKSEKRELSFIQELELKEGIDEERKMHEMSNQIFESNITLYKEQNAFLQKELAASKAREELAENLRSKPTVSEPFHPGI